jgi:hypothetical protein
MIKKEFVGLNKNKAAKKAIDYWYKNFLNIITLRDFLIKCTWKKEGGETIVIYRGPAPPINK